MIIRKYVADTMNEAISMIKLELGPDAIIVSKRSVKQKGIFGAFLPKKLEITAAIEDTPKVEPQIAERIVDSKTEEQKKEIERELNQVKEMLQRLVDDKKVKKEKKTGMRRLLMDRDVSEDVINLVTDMARKRDKYKNSPRLPDTAVAEQIQEIIKANLPTEGRVHVFIGPTGVGKTTTIAKLAAIKALSNNKKIGLITIDTYRIGAVEQLKIYADILGLPFEVINSISDVDKCFENLKDCDMIFVDTTGRSIKNVMQLSELKMYIDKIAPDNIYLVVSMTTKYNDLMQILHGFSTMNYDSIILTKLDETTTYGSILNIACNATAPISYITIGQNVPDDIAEATKERLLDLVIGEGTI